VSKATKRERQKENRERARIERDRLVKRDRQMKTLRGFAILAVIFVVGLLIINALSSSDNSSALDKNKFYSATIETSQGNIVVALDAKKAPVATQHFIDLVNKKFYDGLCIDRLSRDFVIQGGSPKCDAKGGSGSSVNGETPTDHYPIGSLAAAKTGSAPAGTFDSSFFIVTGSQGGTLPNDYARFGKVISGLDVAQKIEKLPLTPSSPTNPNDGKPVSKITIKRIRITSSNKAPAVSSTTTAPPGTSPSTEATPSTTAAATSSSTTPASSTSSSTPSTTKPATP
jgi:cyclophilin family peptidyl-prolyl cis-trans isomerase